MVTLIKQAIQLAKHPHPPTRAKTTPPPHGNAKNKHSHRPEAANTVDPLVFGQASNHDATSVTHQTIAIASRHP
ncbi:hypothetical protein CDAR_527631 [Caerostris darwini]|uniref:Uncharacterized protein n=1 Tax=Caerostris darwini TaxID=1538125 RepID=A0AAV4RD40_9ARAC|nr:hypothetical protein CDAR_527631 [Caerostris darwini]